MAERIETDARGIDRWYKAQLESMEEQRDAAQRHSTILQSQVTVLKGQVAGYKLAARLLGRFPRYFANFTARAAMVALNFSR